MRREFLFVLWSGGGNVPPQLVLARQLAERGHTVRVLAPAVLRSRIEAAGLRFEPYRSAPEHDEGQRERSLIRDFEARTPVGALKATRERLIAGTAAAFAADTLALVREHGSDAVVLDYLLIGAAFGAEVAGVPAVPLVHHVWPFPASGVPPFGMGWQPSPTALGRLRDALGHLAFEQMMARPLLAPLNRVRRDLGLVPLQHAMDAFTATSRVLVLTSEAFDFEGQRPPAVTYVGPQLGDAGPAPTWVPPGRDGRPLVLVGLSTTYQRQEGLLTRVIDALGSLPVRGLVATGPVTLEADPPANVELHQFIPHDQAMAQADAVITHAGHGTVMAALAAGVPMVCLPIARDQPDVAARVAASGAGMRLSPRSKAEKIAAALTAVLREPRYGENAGRLQAAIAADVRAQRAVTELEAVAASPRQGERTPAQ